MAGEQPPRVESASGETIAGTGPGIPDDALAPGETLPDPPGDAEFAAAARRLGAPIASLSPDDVADPGRERPA